MYVLTYVFIKVNKEFSMEGLVHFYGGEELFYNK